jgi:hypothetical protein
VEIIMINKISPNPLASGRSNGSLTKRGIENPTFSKGDRGGFKI